MNRITSVAVLALVALLATTLPAAAQANVAGSWVLTVNGPEGPTDINAVLAQDGSTVTGAFEVPQVGSAEMSDGVIQDSKLTFLMHIDVEGQYFTIEVTAEVAGDQMTGEFYVPEFGGMTFTGKRADG